jgi:hypothetical protein
MELSVDGIQHGWVLSADDIQRGWMLSADKLSLSNLTYTFQGLLFYS